jgi:hypothetical protein
MGWYEHKSPLIETSFHAVVQLLTENTAAIKEGRVAIRCMRRVEGYVGGSVGDGEVEDQVLFCFCVLSFREAERDLEAFFAQKKFLWRWAYLLKQMADRSVVEKATSGGYRISTSGPIGMPG